MKAVKVKLAFPSEKPVNFKIGEVNVRIGKIPTSIEQQWADIIIEQYPGWIELVVKKKAAKLSLTTKEA